LSTPSSPRPFSPAPSLIARSIFPRDGWYRRRLTIDATTRPRLDPRRPRVLRAVSPPPTRADAQKNRATKIYLSPRPRVAHSVSARRRPVVVSRPSHPSRAKKSTRRCRRSIDRCFAIDRSVRSVRTARSTKSRDRGAGMRRPTGPWRQSAPRGKGANERRVASRDGATEGERARSRREVRAGE